MRTSRIPSCSSSRWRSNPRLARCSSSATCRSAGSPRRRSVMRPTALRTMASSPTTFIRWSSLRMSTRTVFVTDRSVSPSPTSSRGSSSTSASATIGAMDAGRIDFLDGGMVGGDTRTLSATSTSGTGGGFGARCAGSRRGTAVSSAPSLPRTSPSRSSVTRLARRTSRSIESASVSPIEGRYVMISATGFARALRSSRAVSMDAREKRTCNR